MLRLTILSLLTLCLIAAPAGAATILLSAVLDGPSASAGAGTGSLGTGVIDITLDDVTGDMSWSGSFSGLSGVFTVAHFHGPALPNQNGGVEVGTAVTIDPGGQSGTSIGNATLSAQQIADLVGGLWYWNVHSSVNTGGEIRGNLAVVPEPSTGLLLALGLATIARRRR